MCLSVIFGNLHESHLHVKVCSADKSTASRFSKSYLNRLRNSIYNLKKRKKQRRRERRGNLLTLCTWCYISSKQCLMHLFYFTVPLLPLCFPSSIILECLLISQVKSIFTCWPGEVEKFETLQICFIWIKSH